MPEKNIPDSIQNILEKNRGFMVLSKLCKTMSPSLKQRIGIRNTDSVAVLRRRIENSAEDRFLFVSKGKTVYILIPCNPSDIVLGLLSSQKALDTRTINALPFSKEQFVEIVNDLIDEGKATIKFGKNFGAQIFKADSSSAISAMPVHDDSSYTQEQFREAFDALKKGRITVRICDLRIRLGWPRDVFDNMLVTLRDNDIIELRTGDTSTMTVDEVKDCFIDENGFRRGLVIWNG